MRVALVHDYLDQFGGQERVLLNLTELFPKAPIYTLLYEPKSLGDLFKDKEIHTSFVDKHFIRKRHRLFIPILGHAAKSLNLGDKYDLIITNTMGFAKGVNYQKGVHISYMHTPLRYAWEPWVYLPDLFPKSLIWAGMPTIQYIRYQDKKFSQKPDYIFTNSEHISQKVKQFYNRDSIVVHPPINDDVFYYDPRMKKQEYYVIYGRIIHYKKFPMVIRAFKEMGRPLKIIGSGPEENVVKKLVNDSDNCSYLPFIQDENRLREIISGARASIVPQLEDFGLVTAESIACGTPVIGYNAGGTKEIVQQNINGILFNEQSENGIIQAVEQFEKMSFDPKMVSQTAEKFSKENFRNKFSELVNSAMKGSL